MRDLTLQVTRSLHDFDPAKRDSFSAGRAFQSYRWYKFGERVMADCPLTALLVRDGDEPVIQRSGEFGNIDDGRISMIELNEFLKLPTEEVARLVRESGPKVCVFPINGTRRWFVLEHAKNIEGDPIEAYMDKSIQNHIELYKLFFDHGINTLVTPEFGSELLLRGDDYVQKVGAEGMARLASESAILDFYDDYDVRVHFYGDHRRFLRGTKLDYLSDLFDLTAERTRTHSRYRLFIGIFGNDATQAIAEFSASHYQQQGRIPEKPELIEMYYGEYVEPVSMFIGFDRFSAFDMPLIATGEEDLYFTISPSPYMNPEQLRGILYDHLYTRRVSDPEYEKLNTQELQDLRNFYTKHSGYTFGAGELVHGIWVPQLP